MIGKIKMGSWDGQDIWREKTAGELLAEQLENKLYCEYQTLEEELKLV